jgi:hypothetical protein
MHEEEEEDDEEEEHDADDSEWIPPQLADSFAAVTRSTRRRSSLSKPKSRTTATPSVLPLDAPIQSRNYSITSRTSRKPIPQSVLKSHSRALESGEITKEQLEEEANRRRRMNTLSARESRRRKEVAQKEQAKENVELKEEREWLRERVEVLEGEKARLTRRVEELEGAVESGRSKRRRIE